MVNTVFVEVALYYLLKWISDMWTNLSKKALLIEGAFEAEIDLKNFQQLA
jgi:hypothetical protein